MATATRRGLFSNLVPQQHIARGTPTGAAIQASMCGWGELQAIGRAKHRTGLVGADYRCALRPHTSLRRVRIGLGANLAMNAACQALDQLISGRDFDPPAKLLANIKSDAAARVPPGAPYSIATNVAHADIWQRVWLTQLEGQPKFNPFPDFPVIPAESWPETRTQFLKNLERARELAAETAPDDEKRQAKLLQFAIHGAYHIGQVKLLKRLLRAK